MKHLILLSVRSLVRLVPFVFFGGDMDILYNIKNLVSIGYMLIYQLDIVSLIFYKFR